MCRCTGEGVLMCWCTGESVVMNRCAGEGVAGVQVRVWTFDICEPLMCYMHYMY